MLTLYSYEQILIIYIYIYIYDKLNKVNKSNLIYMLM